MTSKKDAVIYIFVLNGLSIKIVLFDMKRMNRQNVPAFHLFMSEHWQYLGKTLRSAPLLSADELSTQYTQFG